MAEKKKKTPQKETEKALKSHSEKTGLSIDELRIISEMLKDSLVSEFGGPVQRIQDDENESFENHNESFEYDNYPDEYYEATEDTEDSEEYNVESFRAHSPSENFYSVNSVKECPMCGSTVGKFGHYSLEFGTNIRKRANFCGLDCLKEFIDELSFSKGF